MRCRGVVVQDSCFGCFFFLSAGRRALSEGVKPNVGCRVLVDKHSKGIAWQAPREFYWFGHMVQVTAWGELSLWHAHRAQLGSRPLNPIPEP